jgi:beta-lactamase regulating signal transducer with metallopeptidase domain
MDGAAKALNSDGINDNLGEIKDSITPACCCCCLFLLFVFAFAFVFVINIKLLLRNIFLQVLPMVVWLLQLLRRLASFVAPTFNFRQARAN